MKIPRSVIGQHVEIVWRDPGTLRRCSVEKAPKGWQGMATWRERGIVDDVTDGIVRLIQSEAVDAPGDPEPGPLEVIPAYIHEALIEDCFLFDSKRSLKGGAGEGHANI